jgi:hypothetical protein
VSPTALHKASFCTPLADAIHQQPRPVRSVCSGGEQLWVSSTDAALPRDVALGSGHRDRWRLWVQARLRYRSGKVCHENMLQLVRADQASAALSQFTPGLTLTREGKPSEGVILKEEAAKTVAYGEGNHSAT